MEAVAHILKLVSPHIQVTLIEVTSDKEVRLMVEIQSSRWRWNIGITQVSIC